MRHIVPGHPATPTAGLVERDGEVRTAQSIPSLTVIRGVAAAAVFLCHLQPMALQYFGYDPNQSSHFIANGFRGVDLFFILSGFILFHVHWADFRKMDTHHALRFYILRFFRVYPLNGAILLMMVPLSFFLPQFVDWHRAHHISQGAYHANDFSFPAFIQAIFLAQTWTFIKPGTWNEPAWTLSAEIFGYALFPVIAVMANQIVSTHSAINIALGSLVMFVVAMIVGGHATNNPSGSFGLVRMTFCFVSGVCLCRAYHLTDISGSTAACLTYVSIGVIVLTFSIDKIGILSVMGFGGLILGLAYQPGSVNAIFNNKMVHFVGTVSFSFYLIHLLCLELLFWTGGALLPLGAWPVRSCWFLLVVVTPFIVAATTYRRVERPFQKFGRQVAAKAVASKQTQLTV